jgi:DNA-binding LacI/PurR family transcriptional regulator
VISPALSCVAQPSYEQGSKAVELMLASFAHPEPAKEQHLILPTDLLLRETCTGKSNVVRSKDIGQKVVPVHKEASMS